MPSIICDRADNYPNETQFFLSLDAIIPTPASQENKPILLFLDRGRGERDFRIEISPRL